MDTLLTLLTALEIPFTRFDHKPVFTCAESEGLDIAIPGAHTKQLLMKAKNKELYVLAIVLHDKRVDTKALAKDFGVGSFSFASPEVLKEKLGVTPGAVTPFGLIYDSNKTINVVVDEDAWNMGVFRFHPLVNTATLTIDREGFQSFLRHTGHGFVVRQIPKKNFCA